VPDAICRAGYIGASIYDDKIVLAYIGGEAGSDEAHLTYDISMAWLDLKTQTWHGPWLLEPCQRDPSGDYPVSNWTNWLYPIIHPGPGGIEMAISNCPDHWARYEKILYINVPWNPPAGYRPVPEKVAPPFNGGSWIVYAMSMWRASDGSPYITDRYQPVSGQPDQLIVHRRDPHTGQWSASTVGSTPYGVDFMFATLYEDQFVKGRLWVAACYAREVRLFRSTDKGKTWKRETTPGFEPYKLESGVFLQGISQFSGSAIPDGPIAVFNSGKSYAGHYADWFIQFHTPRPQEKTAAKYPLDRVVKKESKKKRK
jgi:hypothetical protein